MKRLPQSLVCLTLLGCFAIWAVPVCTSAPEAKDKGLPEADLKATIAYNQKIVEGALGTSGKVEKPNALKAKTAAWMIAAAAQSGGTPRNKELATIRNAAIKLAKTIGEDKFDEARAQVKALTSLKPDESAKMDHLKLVVKEDDKSGIELEDIMNQFASPRGGGLGYEDELEDWEKELPALPKVAQAANQMSVVFEAIHSYQVEKGPQSKFERYADAAYARARELAEAAAKGDKPGALKAVKALNQSCETCHKDFKDKQ